MVVQKCSPTRLRYHFLSSAKQTKKKRLNEASTTNCVRLEFMALLLGMTDVYLNGAGNAHGVFKHLLGA